MIKKVMIIVFACGFGGNILAQTSAVKPLKVGDKMPDLTLSNIINYGKKSVKISDFKGRLLILDFWATWCHYCIEAFPENDSLQKKFNKDVQFMLVNTQNTGDDEKKVADFYKKRLTADKGFILPSVYMDTVLTDLFPRVTIPHYVWVDKSGVIVGITDSRPVTLMNIEAIVAGKEIQLPTKME